MTIFKCSTRTLQAFSICFTESGSGKSAGKYSRAASGNFGSATLSQRVMERVSKSQWEVMYCRTGPRPGSVCADAILGKHSKASRKTERMTWLRMKLDRRFRSMAAESSGGLRVHRSYAVEKPDHPGILQRPCGGRQWRKNLPIWQ